MQRKSFHQKDYDNGDRRIREAAEFASNVWFKRRVDLMIEPQKLGNRLEWVDLSSGCINAIAAMYNYPVELLKTENEYTITYTPKEHPYDNYPFEIKNGETYVFGIRCTEIDGYFWPIKDLPFDNLGI